MVIFTNSKKLLRYLSDFVYDNSVNVISIDGVDGSGKSYLSNLIIKENQYVYFDIDGSYLNSDDGKYLEHIKYDKLKSDLKQVLLSNAVVVIDGICITQILKKIGIQADLKIYVKKIRSKTWHDGHFLDYSRDVETMLNEKRKVAQKHENCDAHIECREPEEIRYVYGDMKSQIFRYHFEYQPDNNANIAFERITEKELLTNH